jgi:hypothetical protein
VSAETKPRATKGKKADYEEKSDRAKKKAPTKGDLFGPDDEAMSQNEINELIKKLGPES